MLKRAVFLGALGPVCPPFVVGSFGVAVDNTARPGIGECDAVDAFFHFVVSFLKEYSIALS